MSLANDTILITPGSGATLAAYSPASGTTRLQVYIPANWTGHLVETEPTYGVMLPTVDSVANRYHWELFNASSSNLTLLVRSIRGMPSSDTATSNNLSMRFDLFRTTAVSSGGTAANTESSSTLAPNFSEWDTTQTALPAGVTCKTVLTSITTGAWLGHLFRPTAVPATARWDTVMLGVVNRNLGDDVNEAGAEYRAAKRIILHSNEGIACRQGTVASTMSYQWLLQFTAV